MHHIGILKTAHNVHNSIDIADISQELVAQAFAVAGATAPALWSSARQLLMRGGLVILAATALPMFLPPREIDGAMHADGAIATRSAS